MSVNSPICIDDGSSLSSLDESSDGALKPINPSGRARKPFVLLPRFSSQRKRLYKPLNEISFGANLQARVDEVIGEYREGDTLYYFARYDGGIARKVRVLRVYMFCFQELSTMSPVSCVDICS
jgi:hypothetical protein